MAMSKAQITAAYRVRHPDRVKDYAARTKEKQATRAREHYQKNRAVRLAQVKAYRAANPEYRKRKQLTDRTIRSAHALRRMVWALLRQRDGDGCQICNLPIAPGEESIDHILPLSLGGSHGSENLRLLHRPCNVRRPKGRFKTKV